MPVRPLNPKRMMAQSQLEHTFPTLSESRQMELATSIVRQWACNQGRAVVFTKEHLLQFRLIEVSSDEHQVVRDVQPNQWIPFLRSYFIPEDDIQELLHELNLCQSAMYVSPSGKNLQLTLNIITADVDIRIVDDEEV